MFSQRASERSPSVAVGRPLPADLRQTGDRTIKYIRTVEKSNGVSGVVGREREGERDWETNR